MVISKTLRDRLDDKLTLIPDLTQHLIKEFGVEDYRQAGYPDIAAQRLDAVHDAIQQMNEASGYKEGDAWYSWWSGKHALSMVGGYMLVRDGHEVWSSQTWVS